MDYPISGALNGPIINTISPEAVGVEIAACGLSPASIVWPTAETAIFIPFKIYHPSAWSFLGFVNGDVQDGNFEVGLYNMAGRLIDTTGTSGIPGSAGQAIATALSGGSALLHPGRYYIALVCSSGSAEIRGWDLSDFDSRAIGVMAQASSYPLPALIAIGGIASEPVSMVPLAFLAGLSSF